MVDNTDMRYPSTGYINVRPEHFDLDGILLRRRGAEWPNCYVWAEALPDRSGNVFGVSSVCSNPSHNFRVELGPWLVPTPMGGPTDCRLQGAWPKRTQ